MKIFLDIEVLKDAILVGILDENEYIPIYFTGSAEDEKNKIRLNRYLSAVKIGFNVNEYDLPVIDALLKKGLLYALHVSRNIIEDNKRINHSFKKTIDLSTLFPYKAVSLKWIGIHFGFIPKEFSRENFNLSIHKINRYELEEYNLRDLLITKQLFERERETLLIKKKTSSVFSLNLWETLNLPFSEIGERVICKRLGVHHRLIDAPIPPVYPEKIIFKEVINFASKYNIYIDDVVKYYQSGRFLTCPGYERISGGIKVRFGSGGIHGSQCGLYQNVLSVDVKSYYPTIVLTKKISPYYLRNTDFVDVYEEFYKERMQNPDETLKRVYKDALNSVVGKSKSEVSIMKDLHFFYSVTVNGQIALSLLSEILHKSGNRIVCMNTDGIEYIGDTPVSETEGYMQEIFSCQMTSKLYDVLFIRDENNMTGISGGKVYQKGVFSENKDLVKDPSAKVVPKVFRKMLESKIKTSRHEIIEMLKKEDPSDFIMYLKEKKNKYVLVDNDGKKYDLPHVFAYVCSVSGYILESSSSGKSGLVHTKSRVMPVMNISDINPENINYRFYAEEILKLLVISNQLTF